MMIIVKIIGVPIGTATTHGDFAADNTTYYNFAPSAGIGLPHMNDITIDFIEGQIEHWDSNHQMVDVYSIHDLLNDPLNVKPLADPNATL